MFVKFTTYLFNVVWFNILLIVNSCILNIVGDDDFVVWCWLSLEAGSSGGSQTFRLS